MHLDSRDLRYLKLSTIGFLSVCEFFVSGCSSQKSVFSQVIQPPPAVEEGPPPTTRPTRTSTPDDSPTPRPTSTETVCNPFSSGVDPKLWARLRYVKSSYVNSETGYLKTSGSSVTTVNSTMDILSDSRLNAGITSSSGVDFFFSTINFPNVDFKTGFTVQNPQGQSSTLKYPAVSPSDTPSAIVSYFGFIFNSDLLLPANSGSQRFRFATLSDDGSMVYMSSQSQPGPDLPATMIVNNDGVHSTSFACGSGVLPVTLSDTVTTHLRVDWIQGPPTFLGIQLYFRPWIPGGDNSTCNSPSTDSVWQVVPASYYHLPANAPLPSCS